jgi:hypothetical protein
VKNIFKYGPLEMFGISWKGGGIEAVYDLGFTFLLGRMTDVHAPDIYRAHCKIKA